MKSDLQSERLVEVGMGAGASCSEHGGPPC